MKIAEDKQNNHTDLKRIQKEFQVGEHVFVKIKPRKISFGFYLNNIPVDHMSSIMQILFHYGNMKEIMYFKIRWQS